jgi:hypothetical protein
VGHSRAHRGYLDHNTCYLNVRPVSNDQDAPFLGCFLLWTGYARGAANT